jgi:hypothetical protein
MALLPLLLLGGLALAAANKPEAEDENNFNENCDELQAEIDRIQKLLDDALANQDDGIGQADVDAAFQEGADSVDITSDNAGLYQDGYDDGLLANPDDGSFDDGYSAGFDDGVASVDVPDGTYADGYIDGQNSVDITSDNQGLYQDGFDDGAASVNPDDGISQADLNAISQAWRDAISPITENLSAAEIDLMTAEIEYLEDNSDLPQADIDALYNLRDDLIQIDYDLGQTVTVVEEVIQSGDTAALELQINDLNLLLNNARDLNCQYIGLLNVYQAGYGIAAIDLPAYCNEQDPS